MKMFINPLKHTFVYAGIYTYALKYLSAF